MSRVLAEHPFRANAPPGRQEVGGGQSYFNVFNTCDGMDFRGCRRVILQPRGGKFCYITMKILQPPRGCKIVCFRGISRVGEIASSRVLNYRVFLKYTRFPSFRNNPRRNGSLSGIAGSVFREEFHAQNSVLSEDQRRSSVRTGLGPQ